MTITADQLYQSIYFGCENLKTHQRLINSINVFPVADGDTGTNVFHTIQSVVRSSRPKETIGELADQMAQSSLLGARGNSGMIIAQFFQGFYMIARDFEKMGMKEFIESIQSAVLQAHRAVDHPVEGTILSVMTSWAEELSSSWTPHIPIPVLLRRGLRKAREAERLTQFQMKALTEARVVDAGAKAFVTILEGIDTYLVREHAQEHPITDEPSISTGTIEEVAILPERRYCTEALIRLYDPKKETELKEVISPFGDSLVVGTHKGKMRVHIHTDEPARLFERIATFGTIEQQKVDDMLIGHLAAVRRLSDVCILTDSSADIPAALIEELRIYPISQLLQWGDHTYLDKVSIDTGYLLEHLDDTDQLPTSSMPSVGEMVRHLEFLSGFYKSIIILSISSALSGTYRTYEHAIEQLGELDTDVRLIDTRVNATAQGLLTIYAARLAAEGKSPDQIVTLVSEACLRSEIRVSVQSLEMMIRSGRITRRQGRLISKTGIKPIVGLTKEGKGTIKAARFTTSSSISYLIRCVLKAQKRRGLLMYGISHACNEVMAQTIAEILTERLGFPPAFCQTVSPVIALHAGKDAVSVAFITET